MSSPLLCSRGRQTAKLRIYSLAQCGNDSFYNYLGDPLLSNRLDTLADNDIELMPQKTLRFSGNNFTHLLLRRLGCFNPDGAYGLMVYCFL